MCSVQTLLRLFLIYLGRFFVWFLFLRKIVDSKVFKISLKMVILRMIWNEWWHCWLLLVFLILFVVWYLCSIFFYLDLINLFSWFSWYVHFDILCLHLTYWKFSITDFYFYYVLISRCKKRAKIPIYTNA